MEQNSSFLLPESTAASRRTSLTVRDVTAVGFRRKHVLVRTFLATAVLGVALALLLPVRYRSEMKILLEKNRQDPAVSAGALQPPPSAVGPSEDEVNSEVELLNSYDLMRQVVVNSGLDQGRFVSLSGLFRHDQDFKTAKAVGQLRHSITIEPSKKTTVLVVSYSSGNPQVANRVLTNVLKSYLEKHAQVHHSSAELDFFEKQKQRLWNELSVAEAKLAAFPDTNGVVAGAAERDVILQKLGDLKMTQQTTAAAIDETTKRIAMLRQQIASTPARVTTQLRNSDNPQLMQHLKGTLLDLQLKRSELLQKYQPTYRPVRDLDKQIALARESITRAETAPLHDVTTDLDPTHQWMRLELAKGETELRGLQARAKATAESIRQFEDSAGRFNSASIGQQDLVRETKALEESYQLYVRKAEEARINQALDRNGILNVSVAEPPTYPVLPEYSRVMYLAAALALAFIAGTGSVLVAELMDHSFQTPADVERYLDIPVYAALPARPQPSSLPAEGTHS